MTGIESCRKGDKRMKQAEHPPVTAGASIAAEYSLALIDQLARIDRTCSKEEMDELVYRLLSLIGEAMQSDRVFLFERLEGTAEAYCNTFEWCANGVAPQIDNLTEIVPADMPYWLEVFGRGETIVIPNIEDVKTQMPSEYEILKTQSIHSEIAVPVFYRGNLSGFFGLDNPQRAMTAGQLRLLAFVGGHLGSARENLRMLTLLEEKQKSLEQNLQAVKLEQQMLKVLCKDSTSVYRVDLMNDRAEIVKIEEHSNSAGDLLPHGQELFSYAEAVEHYYHKCVLKESAPDFLQFLDAENLMRELRTKDRVGRRYQSVPNAIGNIYFEVRANRVQQTETSFQILLDFRSVDEIVREEREHQHALETALTESRMSYEVISAISKIYYTIYRIDLRTGYYEEVASERQMHRLTGHSGKASIHMSAASKQSIVPEYLPYVEPFFDLSTLAERLRHEDSVMLEYPVRDGNWHLTRFISGKLHDISHNVLLSDQIRLGQIYMNLLSNTVKYTPEKPLTVLVAEDNDLNYEITAEQLRGYRLHCVRAVNGQDCLQQIEQAAPDEFDAILMDMQMPVMNGLEATAAIRKLDSETAKHIPIIALTANAYHEDIQKCLAAGMNAHLSKPINIDRAVRTIIECARTAKENG